MISRALLLLALATCGCAPALSGFQPAHVAKKGHVQAELGMDVSIPTGTLVAVVDAGTTLANVARSRELTEEEQKTLFDAGIALGMNPPSVTPHFGIAYTALEAWELDFRYSTSAYRFGTRVQLLHAKKHGVDLSIGAGVARYVYEFPVGSILDIVEIEDFTRWQFDLPITIGKSGSWYRVWGGPRLMYTTFGAELSINLPASTGYAGKREIGAFSGTGIYVGGQAGVAFGYKYVFFAVELTLAELFARGELNALGKRARNVDLDSFVVYPSVGLMGEF